MPVIRQLVTTATPQHVRMNFHIETSGLCRSLNHGLEAAF
jgi:hypothetical protein